VLLVVLGVAFSGPYQEQYTLHLARDQATSIGSYQIKLNQLYEGESRVGTDGTPNVRFIEAELIVGDKNGAPLGVLSPQRRLYANFESQTYAEVDTLFSLGKEIYATLLSIDESGRATLTVNVNPLVNWLWIGGTVMCIFPFFGLRRVRRMKTDQ
jgi:cytochrome c-type biogenesis protein CcmF